MLPHVKSGYNSFTIFIIKQSLKGGKFRVKYAEKSFVNSNEEKN